MVQFSTLGGWAAFADNPSFCDITTRMKEECEVDARMKFELGVIDTRLAPLWMSKHGYSAKQETSIAKDSDVMAGFLRATRPSQEEVEALCWEDGPHFLRLPINSNLPRPPAAALPASGQHSPAYGPGLEGIQLLPASGTAVPPAPVNLFYHAFTLLFWVLCAKCALQFFSYQPFNHVCCRISP